MLLRSARWRPGDLDTWTLRARQDPVRAHLAVHRRRVERAAEALAAFAAMACYAGVSWGKDSVVVAHLVATVAPHVPLVWVRVGAVDNPDCVLVRDAFLARWPAIRYEEVESAAGPDGWLGTGVLKAGFAEAARRHGDRHVSGVRGDESAVRALRVARWGESTARTCAPIARWEAADVWAYLHTHDLPVHPAYACSLAGILDRDRIRVASIGGERGTGHGRREWEQVYYPRESRIRAGCPGSE